MADFPKIKPSTRRFVLGDYPTKFYKTLSGKVTRRNFGNKAFGHSIELSFDNIKEDIVQLIISHYDGQGGQTNGFAIPLEIFSGLSLIQNSLRSPSETLWFYAEAPSISSVYRDMSSVTIKLVAEIV
jgi:hypothetical protein